MLKVFFPLLIAIFVSWPAFCRETICAKETNSFFYKDGNIKQSEGRFQNTYLFEGNKVIRTRVYNIINKEIISDNTIYTIHRGLASDPNINMLDRKHIIRAVGQPGTDAIEILVIDFIGGYINSIKSTADYFVISRYHIVK
jgi:hypothetical protein